MQLDLFGSELSVTVENPSPKMTWSFSKMQTFRDCPRRYYYQYYGSKKRTAKTEPLKLELIQAAKLSNRYMVQGHVIHLAISVFLKRQRNGETWELNRLISFATKIINDILDYNEKISKGYVMDTPSFQIPLLKEISQKSHESHQLRLDWTDLVRNCLENFYTNPIYEHLRRGSKSLMSKIEGDTAFSLTESINVDGKVDLAFLLNEILMVADWKTGKKEMQDTSLQLLVYVLWAKSLSEWKFSEVIIQKAYLQENELEELAYSELHVNRARVKIIQDSSMLVEMHPFGIDAISDAFIQHVGKNCGLCPFEKICHKNIPNHGN